MKAERKGQASDDGPMGRGAFNEGRKVVYGLNERVSRIADTGRTSGPTVLDPSLLPDPRTKCLIAAPESGRRPTGSMPSIPDRAVFQGPRSSVLREEAS